MLNLCRFELSIINDKKFYFPGHLNPLVIMQNIYFARVLHYIHI